MAGFAVFLLVLALIYTAIISVLIIVSYFEGKDDALRYYGTYSNDHWMPMAWGYNLGYTKYEGKKRESLNNINKKRFNRE